MQVANVPAVYNHLWRHFTMVTVKRLSWLGHVDQWCNSQGLRLLPSAEEVIDRRGGVDTYY